MRLSYKHAYKIASFELTDIPLIKYVAKTGKPILMSTGMATKDEIAEALEAARSYGARDILLFHCISSYPTPIEQANLNMIPILKKEFGVEVGRPTSTPNSFFRIGIIFRLACSMGVG